MQPVCRENNCNLLLNAGLRGDGTVTPIEREMLGYLGKWIKLNKAAVYNAQKCDVTADNAVVLTDGKWYYAVAHDVAMSCDINVARAVERKHNYRAYGQKSDERKRSRQRRKSNRYKQRVRPYAFCLRQQHVRARCAFQIELTYERL